MQRHAVRVPTGGQKGPETAQHAGRCEQDGRYRSKHLGPAVDQSIRGQCGDGNGHGRVGGPVLESGRREYQNSHHGHCNKHSSLPAGSGIGRERGGSLARWRPGGSAFGGLLDVMPSHSVVDVRLKS